MLTHHTLLLIPLMKHNRDCGQVHGARGVEKVPEGCAGWKNMAGASCTPFFFNPLPEGSPQSALLAPPAGPTWAPVPCPCCLEAPLVFTGQRHPLLGLWPHSPKDTPPCSPATQGWLAPQRPLLLLLCAPRQPSPSPFPWLTPNLYVQSRWNATF